MELDSWSFRQAKVHGFASERVGCPGIRYSKSVDKLLVCVQDKDEGKVGKRL